MKNWNLMYVAGNPEIFHKVITEASSPFRRTEVLAHADKLAARGWRVWVSHKVTGERIFESEAEKEFRLAESM